MVYYLLILHICTSLSRHKVHCPFQIYLALSNWRLNDVGSLYERKPRLFYLLFLLLFFIAWPHTKRSLVQNCLRCLQYISRYLFWRCRLIPFTIFCIPTLWKCLCLHLQLLNYLRNQSTCIRKHKRRRVNLFPFFSQCLFNI